MIGWYSNAGYFKGTVQDLTNISQITFLDINKPFTIPILREIPADERLNEWGAVGTNDITTAFQLIVDRYYGPDWYLTYSAAWTGIKKSLTSQEYIEASEALKTFLPGWNVSWPNTIAFAEQFINSSEIENYWFALHIPNLKRLFLYREGEVGSGAYRVNNDGGLTKISTGTSVMPLLTHFEWSTFNRIGGTVEDVIALKVPFSSYDTLKDSRNFLSIRINCRLDDLPLNSNPTNLGFRYAIGGWKYDTERTGIKYSELFSDGETVDFEGTNPPAPPPEPPGPSEPGGGGGTYDDISDPIEFPDPPALAAVDTGMISLYSPSIGQLRELANYMWSDEFNLDTFKKLFADPMDVIIGLSMVPVRPTIGGIKNIVIGFVDTGVACSPVENQYVTVECGSLDIKEFFGTALDYSPYTKFSIYLPFIGTKELKTDDIMGRTITVRYTVDVLSGACTAHVKCGDSVLYQYSGSCANTIPITSQNWSQMITSIIQLAGAGIATAVSGGAAAPMIPAAANTVLSAKPTIQRAGAVSGAAGFLGIQYPYLIWEHPRQSLPTGYNRFVGYPSNITYTLGELSGFTQIESVHLEGIPATQNELIEIESLLKEGVIF